MTSSQRPDALESLVDTAKPLLSLFGVGRGGSETHNPLDGGLGHFQNVLAAGGHVDKNDAVAARSASRDGSNALTDLTTKLNLGEAASGTADEILASGQRGLHFFTDFGPAYTAWTGATLDLDGLTERYTNEAGLDFGAFGADGKTFGVAQQNVSGSLTEIDPRLADAKSDWTGAAAEKFSAAAATYRSGASDIDTALADAARDISDSVASLEKIVVAKAKTVAGLFADTMPTSGGVVDSRQAQTLVSVAKGAASDEQNQWALLVLGIQVTVHYSFGDELLSFFGSADIERRLGKAVSEAAAQGASQWCSGVLVPEVQTRLRLLDDCCSLTKSTIVGVFDKLVESLRALHNPSPPPAPAVTGPTAAAGTTQAGTTHLPGGSASGALTTGAGSVTSTAHSTPGVTVNPDHSVTLGGGVQVGPKQVDGSFVLTGSDSTGKQRYHVAFDSSGSPHVVQLPAAGSDSVPTTGIDVSAASAKNGSLVLSDDHGIKVGDDSPSGFAVTDSTSGTPHTYQVAFSADGHPHATVLSTAAADPTAGGASGIDSQSAGSTAHLEAADQFGSGVQAQAADSTSPVAGSAAAPAAGHSEGGGMPMMGGMGASGRGGSGEESQRRFPAPAGALVDEDELDQWDRLGPVIG